MSLIAKEQYIKIQENLPILCVDIAVQNNKGEYLLIKRANQPKKGHWWVIGGRLLKGESLERAAARKVKEETGQRVKNIQPIGYYELINGMNPFGLNFKYHTVSVVFNAVIDGLDPVKLDNQSSKFKFSRKLPDDFKVRNFIE